MSECINPNCDATIYDDESDFCSEGCEIENTNDRLNEELSTVTTLRQEVADLEAVVEVLAEQCESYELDMEPRHIRGWSAKQFIDEARAEATRKAKED